MAKPTKNDLRFWVGTLFNNADWDHNFGQLVSWLADGVSDLEVNSIKVKNRIDMDGGRITNLGVAQSNTDAISKEEALNLLNRSSYYYPFSVASGKVDSYGKAAYIIQNGATEIVIQAGNTSPDLVCISSDGTIETETSNTTLTVPSADGTYHIIKEKGNAISLTGGNTKVTISKTAPISPSIGDYWLDTSVVPFVGRKADSSAWVNDSTIQPFCYLGYVKVLNNSATVYTPNYNDNWFDFNVSSNGWVLSYQLIDTSKSAGTHALTAISTILPNDGSYYECIFRYVIDTYGSANNNCNYIIEDADKSITYIYDSSDSATASDDKKEGGQFTVFAKSTTNLQVRITGSGAPFKTTELYVIAYRKINTEVL